LDRLRRVADVFAARKINLGLETGQESAETLAAFLRQLERPNVGVNFDPANLILYEKGDPIAALRVLAPWLQQCHLKDANRTRVPGTWGDEVPVGSGEVDWRRFFATLDEIRFTGYCCFEREAGKQRVEDIRRGRDFVESLLGRQTS
jgi:L-ribulose-5-phosphate 3-epimerase